MLRAFGAFCGAGALALTLAACGGKAPEAEQAAESAPSEAAAGPGVFERIKEVVTDTRKVESYRARITGTADGEALDIEIAYSGVSEPVVEMVLSAGEGEVTFKVRGSEVVMGSEAEGWIRADSGEDAFERSDFQDPFAELDKLLAAESVEKVGAEEVNGVPATKYTGSYRVEDALAELAPREREEVAQAYEEAGVTEVPFTLWVGDDGFPRRLEFVDEEADSLTLDFLEFNSDVTIEFPDEADIIDLSDLSALDW